MLGGTHVRAAPPYEFFEQTFLPVIERMGPVCRAEMGRPGFYPEGEGQCSVEIRPVDKLDPLDLLGRGSEQRRWVCVLLAHLPHHITKREFEIVREHLPGGLDDEQIDASASVGAGNALLIGLRFDRVTEVVSEIGEKGTPESVAQAAAQAARAYLEVDAPVGPHLADQLLLRGSAPAFPGPRGRTISDDESYTTYRDRCAPNRSA